VTVAWGGVARSIYDAVLGLEAMPRRGRLGGIEGARELVVAQGAEDDSGEANLRPPARSAFEKNVVKET
jgi:hypothetical protein